MRVDQFVARTAKRLMDADIDTASLDARLLIQHGLGMSDQDMILQFDRQLSEEDQSDLEALISRRLSREPIAHIIGEREFWGLPFKVTQDTLVPRPDSETLIESVLNRISDKQGTLTLVDIGTGSGCLLLALLHELPNATGVGIDISAGALSVAHENASRLGLEDRCQFVCGDYASALDGRMDILISNPPYLAAGEFDGLAKDVAEYDPYNALVCGESGLESYRSIFASIQAWENKPELLALEIGYRQAVDLIGLSGGCGFPKPHVAKDLGGRDRVLVYDLDGQKAQ